MKTISNEEFKAWMLAQPDDKMVDMEQNDGINRCGCAMYQYAKSKGIRNPICGMVDIFEDEDKNKSVMRLQQGIGRFFINGSIILIFRGTWGELKQHII